MKVSRLVFGIVFVALLGVGISVDLAVDSIGLDIFVRALIKTVWMLLLILVLAALQVAKKEKGDNK